LLKIKPLAGAGDNAEIDAAFFTLQRWKKVGFDAVIF